MNDKYEQLAQLIYSHSKLVNLTGLKNLRQIHDVLIENSIKPFRSIDVPRGTSIADAGSGAGIPGLPLAIEYPECSFVLIETSGKKVNFIRKAVQLLDLKNIEILNRRIEDVARDDLYRESFDMAVSRAVGSIYMMSELMSGLVKIDSRVLLYKEFQWVGIDDRIKAHANKVGLKYSERSENGFMLFDKVAPVDDNYPRRYAVIKRNDIPDENNDI
jgi:16S rRNA (guanine527-N7)-methyltransferase